MFGDLPEVTQPVLLLGAPSTTLMGHLFFLSTPLAGRQETGGILDSFLWTGARGAERKDRRHAISKKSRAAAGAWVPSLPELWLLHMAERRGAASWWGCVCRVWTRRMVLPRSCGACRGLEGACRLWLPLSPSRAPEPLPRRPRGLQRTEVALTNHLHLFLPRKMKTTALAGISAFPSLSCDPEGRGAGGGGSCRSSLSHRRISASESWLEGRTGLWSPSAPCNIFFLISLPQQS